MSAALDDVVVLDLTNTFSSSLTAAFLADFWRQRVFVWSFFPRHARQNKLMVAGTTKLT